MNIQFYNKTDIGKRKKLKKQISGIIIIGIVFIAALWIIGIFAGNSEEYRSRVSILEENHMLKQRVTELETSNAGLEARLAELEAYVSGLPQSSDTSTQSEKLHYENGLYYYNEETQSENPDSPRDIIGD
jgi:hypothetical protein